MEPSQPPTGRFRFGMFEVDLEAADLRRNGRRIRLQEQPFQILSLLLRSPGEVVTREELRKALWPVDTFVEFDQGLNTAIKKVRQALGDSAENPRFIETLPRKGYRFIAPVSPVDLPVQNPRPGWWRNRRLWISLGGLAACVAGVVTWWLTRPPPPISLPLSEFRLTQLTRDSGLTTTPALSPDGKLVAYSSDRAGAGNLDIWVQQTGGGAAVRLTNHEAVDVFPGFSPDGSQIVFLSSRDGGGLFTVPALGGEAKLLSREGERPQFSPDGAQVLYQTSPQGSFDDSRIYVTSSTGGPGKQLEPGFRAAASPIWTPDGRHVLSLGVHPSKGFDGWISSLGRKPPVQTGLAKVLSQQQLGLASLDAWVAEGNFLIFTARSGDSVNLWRLAISPRTWQVRGQAERLTFGVREGSGSVARGGRLVFTSSTDLIRIAGLPVDANRGTPTGSLQYLTDPSGRVSGVDISADSRFLVFRSAKTRTSEIWMKDLVRGRETALTDSSMTLKSMPRISRDGSTVAFEQTTKTRRTLFVAKTAGGPPEPECDDCGAAAGLSPDGKRMVYVRSASPRSTVHLRDLRTGQHRLLLEHPELPLYAPCISWDGRWVVFKGDYDNRRTMIFAARIDGATPPPVQEWTALTEGRAWDDLPRWAPAGNLVYFTSNRDGYRCIWARRVDPLTKRPQGEPFAVRHFHDMQLTMTVLALSQMDLAVSRDRLVFPLAEVKGNIWMMEPKGSARR